MTLVQKNSPSPYEYFTVDDRRRQHPHRPIDCVFETPESITQTTAAQMTAKQSKGNETEVGCRAGRLYGLKFDEV
jgi:hypothetical protein